MRDTEGKERDLALRQQFEALDKEIQKLRQQQHSILTLLKEPVELDQGLMTKERWVEILTQSGMDDEDMHNWHKRFEQMEPQGHLKFLQSLNIDENEIESIREWSREP